MEDTSSVFFNRITWYLLYLTATLTQERNQLAPFPLHKRETNKLVSPSLDFVIIPNFEGEVTRQYDDLV